MNVETFSPEPHEGKEVASLWKSPESKEQFADLADQAIRESHLEQAGTLFFLDRAARPVAWYVKERLKVLFPDQPLPEIKFINIGRNNSKQLQYDDMDFDRFMWHTREAFENHIPQGDIVIVDDYVSFGGTLNAAMKVLSEAFPDHQVKSVGIAGRRSNLVDVEVGDVFPWHMEEAAKGVMEVEDADIGDILSSPIRRSNYDKSEVTFSKGKTFEEVHDDANHLRQEMKELAQRPVAE